MESSESLVRLSSKRVTDEGQTKKARDQKHMEVRAENPVRYANLLQPASAQASPSKRFTPNKERCVHQQLLSSTADQEAAAHVSTLNTDFPFYPKREISVNVLIRFNQAAFFIYRSRDCGIKLFRPGKCDCFKWHKHQQSETLP